MSSSEANISAESADQEDRTIDDVMVGSKIQYFTNLINIFILD